MCGIVGYIGFNKPEKILVEMLKKLDYRGYDSAGIAVLSPINKNFTQSNVIIDVTKTKGKISNLENLLKKSGKLNQEEKALESQAPNLTKTKTEALSNKVTNKNTTQLKSSKAFVNISSNEVFKNSFATTLNNDKVKNCGIGHTRWATHGEANTLNAHPHLSNNNEWAIVHNGIIENFTKLKENLIKNNFSFKSQTDSEVIVNLLQKNFKEFKDNNKTNNLSYLQCVIKTCNSLDGSFALAVINKNLPNTIILAKRKSPLYIAKNNSNIYLSSDPICFENKAKEYYSLEDDEFCLCCPNKITFFNKENLVINKSPLKLESFSQNSGHKNFKHFMQKEINEIPSVLKNIINKYKSQNLFRSFNKNFLKKFNKIILIGCGTAYHACLIGANYLRDFTKIDAHSYVASEFRYNHPEIDNNTLVILVSQSGETADTIAVCKEAKEQNCTTITLTNVEYSTLSKMSHFTLPLCAGTEIAVASTKAYVAQVSVLYLLSKHFSNLIKNTNKNIFIELQKLSLNLKLPHKSSLIALAKELSSKASAFFIGRDYDYVTATEASLKLKEITYINSNSYPAGELKHGFLALIDEKSLLFVTSTKKELLEKTLNGAYEASARGASLIFASQFKLDKQTKDNFKYIIPLQDFKEEVMPIASIIPFQMLAYLVCLQKKLNPDKPRNLAKSVTVE